MNNPMTPPRPALSLRFLLIAVVIAAHGACGATPRIEDVRTAAEATHFWDTPRRGTNYFAGLLSPEWLTEAKRLGIGWVRLTTANWPTHAPTVGRDHLIGSADAYRGIPAEDLDALILQLDMAYASGVPVVLTMLSLPGARWRQHNDDKDDDRLWTDPAFLDQTELFFTDLTARVGHHPALVAINPLNEPRPPNASQLNRFHVRVVAAIRAVNPSLPIMLDVGFDSEPQTIEGLQPFDDPNVLYAVHFYEPWDFTTWRVNKGAYTYPGPDSRGVLVDLQFIQTMFAHVERWQRRHGVESRRVVLAEFGIDRRVGGAAQYLTDVACVAEGHRWHWAFYAFRDWQGMDYELGDAQVPPDYWEALERGESPTLPRVPNPIFGALEAALRGTLDCAKTP